MAITLHRFQNPVARDGVTYRARACGAQREDGLWEGWLEFESLTATTLRSGRETTQPNVTDLKYWATGLTPVFLEGSLRRALEPARIQAPTSLPAPTYEGPAPRISGNSTPVVPTDDVALDPYAIYEKSPDLLRQQLGALRDWHLRKIIRAYALVDVRSTNLESLGEPELVRLIVRGVAATAPHAENLPD